jgi:hypothetical protein
VPSDPQLRPLPRRKVPRPVAPTGKLTLIDKIKLVKQARKLLHQTQTMKIHGSWRSSLFGVGGLATIVFNVASMLLDGDPNTNPDWSVTIPAIITAAALLFTKDANVSNAAHPVAPQPVK